MNDRKKSTEQVALFCVNHRARANENPSTHDRIVHGMFQGLPAANFPIDLSLREGSWNIANEWTTVPTGEDRTHWWTSGWHLVPADPWICHWVLLFGVFLFVYMARIPGSDSNPAAVCSGSSDGCRFRCSVFRVWRSSGHRNRTESETLESSWYPPAVIYPNTTNNGTAIYMPISWGG